MYSIRYLSLVRKDLRDITNYIVDRLKALKAAMDLLDALDSSISRLKQYPYSCKLYQAIGPLKYEYRVLAVKNYLVFYVVIEDIVEIHRVIYSKMNIEKQL